jgi:hypothetical protein
MKFFGTYAELKEKLSSINGYWVDESSYESTGVLCNKLFKSFGAIMTWYVTTGTLQFQGPPEAKNVLEQTVIKLLYNFSINDNKKVPNIKHVDEALNIYIKYRDNLHITEVVKLVQELEQLYHRVNKTDITVE